MKYTEFRATESWPFHVSAGGVVYREGADGLEVLVLYRIVDGNKQYHLPKGTLQRDESLEACSHREVVEESGFDGEITSYLGAIYGEFEHKGILYDKVIHYFAIHSTGQVGEHDNEHDGIEWMDAAEAARLMKETAGVKREDLIVERLLLAENKI